MMIKGKPSATKRPKATQTRRTSSTPQKDQRQNDGMAVAAKIDDIIHGLELDDVIRRRIEMLIATNDVDDIPSRMKVAKLIRQVNPTPQGLEVADTFVLNAVDSSEVYRAAESSDPKLKRIIKAIRKLEKEKYGLDDDQFFLLADMPDDLKALNDQRDQRMREFMAGIMRQYGEDRLAGIYEDPVAYKAFFDERMTNRLKRIADMGDDERTDGIRERIAEMMNDMDTTEVDSSNPDEDRSDV